MNVEVRDFHVPARHPVTDKPLKDKNGKHIPIVTDQKSVYVDGVLFCYLLEKPHAIAMLYYVEEDVAFYVKKQIEEITGETGWHLATKPAPSATHSDYGDEFEDDDEDEDY